jgi:hypothetical protein
MLVEPLDAPDARRRALDRARLVSLISLAAPDDSLATS